MANNLLFVALIVLSLVVFGASLFVNYQAVVGIGLFRNTTSYVSAKYETSITPAGYTFSIWGIIYTWLIAMQVYCQSTICRTNKAGQIYKYPRVLTPTFYVVFILNLCCNMAWLVLWDRELLTYSTPVSALMAATLYGCLASSYVNLYDNLTELRNFHQQGDIIAVRVLVQNGIAVYASWVTVATFLNLTSALVYFAGVSDQAASIGSLTALTVFILCWFVVENFAIDKYVRYTLTIYPTLVWALVGVLNYNWDPTVPSAVFTLALAILTGILFLVRVALVIYRSKTRPVTGYDMM